jgi:predicted hotdog family 3-hydroxylacyl-ACP dehydratase
VTAFPPIEALLPQGGRMRLLSRVLHHDAASTRCAVDASRSELFRGGDGRLPGWLAVEYMAQCAAAHGGLLARRLGESPRPGLFVSARRIEIAADDFAPDARLVVSARHARGDRGLVAFDGALHDGGGRELAAGRLFVYVVEDWSALRGAGR